MPYSYFDPVRSGFKSEDSYHKKMNEIFENMYEDLVRNEINGDKTEYLCEPYDTMLDVLRNKDKAILN